jgi:hypothetical protein
MNWLGMFWEAVGTWIIESRLAIYIFTLIGMIITAVGMVLHGRDEGE